MTYNNESYWNHRVKKFGHTGWSDFVIYCYDQNLRLNAIEQIIANSEFKNMIALDYGCGTGDFSKILSKYCEKVIATDISNKAIDKAKSETTNANIEYYELCNDIFKCKYDLILLITVLQHVLDDVKLSELISKFESSLNKDGIIIAFETFSKDETISIYQKLREVGKFVKIFQEAGLRLISSFNFYHPLYMPTDLFVKYRRNIIVRILNRLCLLRFPGVRYLLAQIAQYLSAKDNGIVEKESNTKILIFKKL
jgi:SAM-dependent methyltransferase